MKNTDTRRVMEKKGSKTGKGGSEKGCDLVQTFMFVRNHYMQGKNVQKKMV